MSVSATVRRAARLLTAAALAASGHFLGKRVDDVAGIAAAAATAARRFAVRRLVAGVGLRIAGRSRPLGSRKRRFEKDAVKTNEAAV
jgi:hypothetical protein